MVKKNTSYINPRDYHIVEEWVNGVWPDYAKDAIKNHIRRYWEVVKLRTSMDKPTISGRMPKNVQLVINYNSNKKCFIVWNAAIQRSIHKGRRMHLPIGATGESLLHKPIASDAITPFFREFRQGGVDCAELILIVGKDAFVNFCQNYMKYLTPDSAKIPKGRLCLHAIAGEEIAYIQADKNN